MSIKEEVLTKAKAAQTAARNLSNLDTTVKNQALLAMADALEDNAEEILAENKKDLEYGKEEGLSEALMDRLLLTEERIKKMANGLREVEQFGDPIGEVIEMKKRPNGMQVGKVRVPLGVIGMIYEARPNVTVDAAGLCLKAGNAIVLRGGSEAINSNKVVAKIIAEAAYKNGIPKGAIQLIETTDREAVQVIFGLNEYIDVLIPRGGPGLIQAVINNSKVPVIETGVGNCHTYIDNEADLNMAKEIIINAKTQRPGVCNAMETLLVHEDIAEDLLPEVIDELQELNVEIHGDEVVQDLGLDIIAATEEDWETEYLDYILAIKTVNSLEEAVDHIHKYHTKHSEAIITDNYHRAQEFLKVVDAAAVYVNASTRFTDGGQFGLGAEIGISTQKLHARGPMGINELTTNKFIIYGSGQIRE
ncbi:MULTISPECIES: glutamate-5-semialdehyde dehydrogenase [unclassified Candidatus Frackibacter]|uniref:glutamate-5-semialdehyde dehydrogenase n=1 Tax=unclassified Candidatus Frackibacter TaxID=2648818 RepID=UPI00079345A3|nr:MULTISPECIES: glutamate-5-semialdehyde dehydrogenase [unclassified Candidatus Frackibacter]KXS43931.1 MAG: glutamate-5-semialdehyde dehydrogenase [Candidatus Frackibacter sp. T328-2]SDC40241.1 glutamate-5-semialdehyde dehydrogenase [Candidatus Frackibacter sp. WG11]SEM60530.1 glutamate-5-semialdehyde dehydrogenase [Candidatus Frackibacter sp. WG12]SFL61449.1 glutamate-5-semialdehyde dehydrogenase [Candidatus Frackibacter sp. WG13]